MCLLNMRSNAIAAHPLDFPCSVINILLAEAGCTHDGQMNVSHGCGTGESSQRTFPGRVPETRIRSKELHGTSEKSMISYQRVSAWVLT